MDRNAERTIPTIEELEADAVKAVEPAEIAGPLPLDVEPAMGDALDPGLIRRNDAQRDNKTTLRRQYDAFVEQHRETLTWKGLAQVGTIVAIEGASAIMHVGRHHFMRFDIRNDLHGTVPEVGIQISVGSDGSITPHDRGQEHSLDRGHER